MKFLKNLILIIHFIFYIRVVLQVFLNALFMELEWSLIQHKKEHQLHLDIKENDKVFYFTTCGWMMWNWLISSLASKTAIVLYDGSPFFPNNEYLFDITRKRTNYFFWHRCKIY